MRIRDMVIASFAAAAYTGCRGDYTPTSPGNGPDPTPTATTTAVDPTGDTFLRGTSFQWDITAFTVARDTGGVTISLDFSSDVISPMSGDPSAIVGYIDLDLDQDSTSGDNSVVDSFRHGVGSTGLGVDATVELNNYAPDSTVAVFDSLSRPLGRVKPVFAGHTITIRLPRATLGNDDGYLNAAAVIGSTTSPTDLVPNAGHLTLNRPQ